MSDVTPRPPEPREPENHGDADLRDRLLAAEPPAHGPDFWPALDRELELVAALRSIETPEHGARFWATFDSRLRAEPSPYEEIPDEVTSRTTVFDDDVLVAARRGPKRRLSRRRLEQLMQLSAAAAIVAVLAGALAWWGTRDTDEPLASTGGTASTTTVGSPPTSVPAQSLLGSGSRVTDPQPASVRGSVPVGASPDGKFLYVASPSQSGERCAFGSSGASTAAMWLYAQPVGGTSMRRILTDSVFADPKMVQGPSNKVVVSDSCNGSTSHVIATTEPNGVLSVDRVVPAPPSAALMVNGVAWSAGGTGIFVRGEGASGWFRYDIANAELDPASEIAPGAIAVEQLANEQIVAISRGASAGIWAVSVGKQEVVALNAPSHNDVTRSVRVDSGHGQVAIAGKEKLFVLTARPAGEVSVGTFEYAAEAVAWAADGNGLIAAPYSGGLDYLSFAPTADNKLSPVSLGFEGVAYSLLAVPDSSSLVVRQGVAQGESIVASGDALLLTLTS